MPFIGIVAKKADFTGIKRNFISNVQKVYSLISIDNNNIDNIKNVKFETILICSNCINEDKNNILKYLLSKAKYILVNSDIVNLENLEKVSGIIITYGFKAKSTITMSSVSEETMVVCVQREFDNINGKTIEPQEICINATKLLGNKYCKMGSLALKILYESQKT